ncbi:hypothetical protein HanRHA438_Chr13g0598621 [Helianthus annuus]|nr:hypothetical protein HanIR_Chr13g0640301 [Helianthus annuus]KAJ0858212.1 hypothetical protein HanRHA438_Chr13g0598621 [Helianthus annuus]
MSFVFIAVNAKALEKAPTASESGFNQIFGIKGLHLFTYNTWPCIINTSNMISMNENCM